MVRCHREVWAQRWTMVEGAQLTLTLLLTSLPPQSTTGQEGLGRPPMLTDAFTSISLIITDTSLLSGRSVEMKHDLPTHGDQVGFRSPCLRQVSP